MYRFRCTIVVLILAVVCFLPTAVRGQGRLVSVLAERDLSLEQQLDSVIVEFGLDVNKNDIAIAFKLLRRFGGTTRCVALKYKTQDPKGRAIEASGIVAFPLNRRFRGVVEMCPYNREKNLCGTARMYSTEILASSLGYVTIMPDLIGYGVTDSLTVAYQMSENSAILSAHLRLAAKEYIENELHLVLPSNSYLFGYSLGAPSAVALAGLYSSDPSYGVKVKALCVGGGAYNPRLALESTLQKGTINYLIYPSLVRSLNYWCDAGLDPAKIFYGRVLEDYESLSSSTLNPREMARIYGEDLHTYLRPEFFTPEGSQELERIKAILDTFAVPGAGSQPIPTSVKVVIRHSENDDIIPVVCADLLYYQIKQTVPSVRYHRERKGTHYETAVRSFSDLARILL